MSLKKGELSIGQDKEEHSIDSVLSWKKLLRKQFACSTDGFNIRSISAFLANDEVNWLQGEEVPTWTHVCDLNDGIDVKRYLDKIPFNFTRSGSVGMRSQI